jgi:hypothetical protein
VLIADAVAVPAGGQGQAAGVGRGETQEGQSQCSRIAAGRLRVCSGV